MDFIEQQIQKLSDEKSQLLHKLMGNLKDHHLSPDNHDSSVTHVIKQAKGLYIDSLNKDAIRLEKVDASLALIETQMYGFCVDCEEELEVSQILRDPAENRCLRCQQHSRYKHKNSTQ